VRPVLSSFGNRFRLWIRDRAERFSRGRQGGIQTDSFGEMDARSLRLATVDEQQTKVRARQRVLRIAGDERV
jgi:hypothetical protein